VSEIVEALDRKAREYMKRIIEAMVDWRKREAELIARLILRNARRLQERLAGYQIVPRKVWSPRGVVTGGPVELPEGEPYALYQVWPQPELNPDMLYDEVKLFNASVEQAQVTKNSNIIYSEYKLVPSSDTGETVKLPKYPFFDNLSLSQAEIIENIEKYLTTVYAEVVLDTRAEYTDCSMREENGHYHYYCRPSSVSYVILQPGTYKPSIVKTVDFSVCTPHGQAACLSGFVYHGEYSGVNIVYFTSDSTQYIVSIEWHMLDGAFTKISVSGTQYDVHVPAFVVLMYVVNENTPANVEFVALHTSGGTYTAGYTTTDSTNNWKYYAVAYWPLFKTSLKIEEVQV